MAFRFPLAVVLKLRESLEQQEYFILLKLQREIAEIEEGIRKAEAAQSAAEAARRTELTQGMPAIHLQEFYAQALSWAQMREKLKAKLQEVETRKQQQLKNYRTARQGREVLEKIRDRQLAEYERAKTQREQARVDDMFLARFNRDN
jgi:flagellar export protein FliJ